MSSETSPDLALHRLKNHLSVILGFAEFVLQDTGLVDGVRADIQEMKKGAESALEELTKLEASYADERSKSA
jgi:hypothetical protein